MRALAAIHDPNQNSTAEVGELRSIGERAAGMYLSQGVPLDDAVSRAVTSSGRRLNNHHVQRIVEFANHKVFRDLRGRSLGKDTKPVSFQGGPASALVVLSRIRSVGDKETKMASYILPRRVPDPGSLLGLSQEVAEVPMEKVAERVSTGHSVEVDPVDLYIQLGNAVQATRSEASALEHKKMAALGLVVKYAGHELRQGASVGDIHRILCTAAGPGMNALVKEAMDHISRDELPGAGLLGEAAEISMQKVSGYLPNPRHPLYKEMQSFVKIAEQVAIKRKASVLLEENRRRLRSVVS